MLLLLAATLEIVGLLSAVLFALGVPLFFGLLAWDLIDQQTRHVVATTPEFAPQAAASPRTVPAVNARHLTA